MKRDTNIALVVTLLCGCTGCVGTATAIANERLELPAIGAIVALSPSAASESLRAGVPAQMSVSFLGAQSGSGAAVAAPRVWWLQRRNEQVAAEASCDERYRMLNSGSLATRADVDFAGFTVATLNTDHTITFINPQLAWNRTKLESVIALPGRPFDWAENDTKRVWAVTLRDENKVVFVDLVTRSLLATIDMGAGKYPERVIGLRNDGFAVVLSGNHEVVMFDSHFRETGRVPVGDGPHQMALVATSGDLVVTAARGNRVTIIDIGSGTAKASIDVNGMPLASVWATHRRVILVAAVRENPLIAIDPLSGKIVHSVSLGEGVTALAMDPSGRFAFALNTRQARVEVIDTSSMRHIATAVTPVGPDQISFTNRFAYVRAAGGIEVSLIDLEEVTRASNTVPSQAVQSLTVTKVPMFRASPGSAPDSLGVASTFATAPSPGAMLIASNADRTLYYYAEGLMAPMGTVDNYRRSPLGIKILNRGLQRQSDGNFNADLVLPAAGRYDVVVALDNPLRVACGVLTVSAAASKEVPVNQSKKVEFTRVGSTTLSAGSPSQIRFKVVDGDLRGETIRYLVFRPPGSWQRRGDVHVESDGTLLIDTVFEQAGRYRLLLSGGPFGQDYRRSPTLELQVESAGKSMQSKASDVDVKP